MNQKPADLWLALSELTGQPGLLSPDRIDRLFGSSLSQAVEPSNESFQFYRSAGLALTDGMALSGLELRVKRSNPKVSLLMLEVTGRCVALDELRKHFDGLQISQRPRGRSPAEATTYAVRTAWGRMAFGFRESSPDCLAYVVVEPAATAD